MARARGTFSITLAGVPIQVAAYHRATRKNQSFKMIDPKHQQPVKSVLMDIDGNEVKRDETGRGVETGKVVYPLPAEALPLIEKVGKTEIVEIARFAPLDTVPLELALESYVLVPNDKVPASEQSVQIFWNGLNKTKLVAIIDQLAIATGARPTTFAVVAHDDGLVGYVLPYAHEVRGDAPAFVPEPNAKFAKVFATFIEGDYEIEPYDVNVYHDTYTERRRAAIDMALAGKLDEIPVQAEMELPTNGGDLMAKLEATLAERAAGTDSKTAAKSKTTTKPRTRRKAAVK